MTLHELPRLPKKTRYTWLAIRASLLIWGIVMLFLGYTTQFLQAVFAILFTHLWDFFQLFGKRTFIANVPAGAQTGLNWFLCLGCLVGTTVNIFTSFAHIDIPSHMFAGFFPAVFGFEFAYILQKDKGRLSPALACMFGFCLAVTILVGWEFYEFTMDRVYGLDLQRSSPVSDVGLIDTMLDLIYGVVGALIGMFSVIIRLRRQKKRKLEAERHAQETQQAIDAL